MSDSLKDRLNSHSNSFEGLLSLIPARYYYDDESSSQWKKKGSARQGERKAEAIQAKQNKFDPDRGTSALDEVKRREEAARQTTEDDEGDDVVIYDDNGNPIGQEREMSVAELLKAKANGDATPDLPETASKSPAKAGKKPAKTEPSKNGPAGSNRAYDVSKATPATENPASAAPPPERNGRKVPAPSVDARSVDGQRSSKQGVDELRARLAARVNELRAIRKAPGSDVSGAPKNREELLAARKHKLEMKKKQGKAPAGEDPSQNGNDESSNEMEEDDEIIHSDISSIADSDSNLIFGQIQFNDGARLGKTGSAFEHQRQLKKRNAIDQLKVLENRKAKINKLDKEKQEEIADNAKWSRAILQSEGAKIRDDEKLLRRTVKQHQNQKKRSEKEWKKRLYNVKKGISDREAKRNTNLRARKEAKKLRLKGKKRRDHMKKAGA